MRYSFTKYCTIHKLGFPKDFLYGNGEDYKSANEKGLSRNRVQQCRISEERDCNNGFEGLIDVCSVVLISEEGS